jgi:hypothetical protein
VGVPSPIVAVFAASIVDVQISFLFDTCSFRQVSIKIEDEYFLEYQSSGTIYDEDNEAHSESGKGHRKTSGDSSFGSDHQMA